MKHAKKTHVLRTSRSQNQFFTMDSQIWPPPMGNKLGSHNLFIFMKGSLFN